MNTQITHPPATTREDTIKSYQKLDTLSLHEIVYAIHASEYAKDCAKEVLDNRIGPIV